MSIWGALAGGFVGTLVLTTTLRAASELGLTRMDLPFLLGTAVTRIARGPRRSATCCTSPPGWSSPWSTSRSSRHRPRADGALGAAVRARCTASFAGTALVNVLLPVVHPRMGTPRAPPTAWPLLEPPGFMMLQLRPAHPAGHDRRPRRLRRHRRRLHRDRELRADDGRGSSLHTDR